MDDDDDEDGDLRVHRPGRTSPVSSCIMTSDDTARTGAGNETIIAKDGLPSERKQAVMTSG